MHDVPWTMVIHSPFISPMYRLISINIPVSSIMSIIILHHIKPYQLHHISPIIVFIHHLKFVYIYIYILYTPSAFHPYTLHFPTPRSMRSLRCSMRRFCSSGSLAPLSSARSWARSLARLPDSLPLTPAGCPGDGRYTTLKGWEAQNGGQI